jgi:hypothetical protein
MGTMIGIAEVRGLELEVFRAGTGGGIGLSRTDTRSLVTIGTGCSGTPEIWSLHDATDR